MSSRRLALRAASVLSSSSPMRRAYPATSAHKIAANRRLTCASATNVSSTKRIQDLAEPIVLLPAGRTRHGNCGASDERDELGVPLVLPSVPGPRPTTSCRNSRIVHRRKIGNRWQGRVNFGHCSDVRCTTTLPPKAEVHPRSCYVAISGYQHSYLETRSKNPCRIKGSRFIHPGAQRPWQSR